MNTKIIAVLFILITLIGTATAATTMVSTAPVLNELYYGGQSYTLDFNISNPDTNGILATVPGSLTIFYSTVAGSNTYLIVTDSNITDGTTVSCNDFNAYGGDMNCEYSWTVPGTGTMPSGTYYIDYNYGDFNNGAKTVSIATLSSPRFQVAHPMSTSITGMLALALFIAAAGLAVFGVMGLGRGMDVSTFMKMMIVAIVLLVIGWTVYATVVVV